MITMVMMEGSPGFSCIALSLIQGSFVCEKKLVLKQRSLCSTLCVEGHSRSEMIDQMVVIMNPEEISSIIQSPKPISKYVFPVSM